ncbi:MAG: J domain-containing protein [Treponema sp.]|nr:J domain-containing protein [Treponema sp.]
MGIIDRLNDVIRSYFSEDSSNYEKRGRTYGADPDLKAAYEELNEFLGQDAPKDFSGKSAAGSRNSGGNGSGFEDQFHNSHAAAVPEALRTDFMELGVPFGADAATCKTAYKKLLKIHHPDRHAGHTENMRKATEKSSRINAAYERIERWRSTGMI